MRKEFIRLSDRNLRRRAENILGERVKEAPSDADMLKLLHELSVHQIELELQNEELFVSKEAATRLADKYTELYDFAPSGYFTLTPGGKITEMNLFGAKMLGRDRAILINAGFEDFIDPGYKPSFRNFLTKIFLSDGPAGCEIRLNNNMFLKLSAIADKGDCKLTALDITTLKETEKRNETLLSELKEANKKLELALDNAAVGSWEYDLNSDEMTIDERMLKILGLDKGTSVVRLMEIIKVVHDDDSKRVLRNFHESAQNGTPLDAVFRMTGSGGVRYVSCKGSSCNCDNATSHCISGVCMDITRIQESSEQSLIKLNDRLARSNSDLENFAYVASHDLQEPLRMVASFTQLLEKQYSDKLDDTAHEYINYAVTGAKRMYELLNSLLAYSRIQTKGQKFIEVDMNEILDTVCDNLQIKIRETGTVIENFSLPVIFADDSQIAQLMQNLLENGIKFSNGNPHITVSSKRTDSFYIISVKDDGIGIEKIYHERIFRIFQKLHSAEEYSGTGIGLAICKSIVERHGGKIWLDSEPGEGTTFHFSIPAAYNEDIP